MGVLLAFGLFCVVWLAGVWRCWLGIGGVSVWLVECVFFGVCFATWSVVGMVVTWLFGGY